MKTPPSLPPPPPRRRTTAGSLLPLLLLVLLVIVRPATGQKYANGNNEAVASASDSVGNGNKFVPPKLSFASSDYYASLRDDNVVKSVHQMYEEAISDPHSFWYVNLVAKEKYDMFFVRFEQKLLVE